MNKLQIFNQNSIKKDIPDIRPGDVVCVYIKEKGEDKKEKIQQFKGTVISRKHKNEAGATIKVRKITQGIGVEKTFPIHSPIIDKIKVIRRTKVRRAKLYYVRNLTAKKLRAKTPTQKTF